MSEECCAPAKKSGWASGLLFGLIPHTFCILFVVGSVVGSVVATSVSKKFLLIPHFFAFLVAISVLLATLSAIFYLKKTNSLSWQKVLGRWKYLSTLYGTTILVNVLVIFVIFPMAANSQSMLSGHSYEQSAVSNLAVDIPCPGHASLIIGELDKVPGVLSVTFQLPNKFKVNYNPSQTDAQKILTADIFKDFKAKVI